MKIHAIKTIQPLLIFLMFMTWSHLALATMLTYQVQIDKNNPYQGKIVVDTSSLQTFEILPARSMMQNKQKELVIMCDEEKGIPLDTPLTMQCDQISWKIRFKAFEATSTNLSQQDNLFIDQPQALWILTEWDTLPRFAKHNKAVVCMSDGILSRYQALPTQQQAPLIMPFGHRKNEYTLKNLDIRLFTTIAAQHEQSVVKKYDAIITYLASIFPNTLEKKQWDVVWLPIEKSAGSAGGAAGHSSFMANYLIKNGQWTEQSEEWLLKISAHEAVHVLTRLNVPLWAGESLAEYYAFKALCTLGIISDTPLQNFSKNKATIPHSLKSLYYAEKRMGAPYKDMSFYPLIYRKGSAFWYEVDTALQKQGGNLDEYIKHLDDLTFIEGKLPETFEAMLQSGMPRPTGEKIKQKYLTK